ncbi:MAG: phospho-N-acetylmuramoyl-pentapeptide-transferase [Actinobacteria bacterium]|jgi:phospho-N-acetylmuramoyl-pentapeptide-transferase|nr:phospho-N-acetylmuramoyl-pentapeptide-transferase [Actinomycetota bacterium]MBU1494338.1 phospho-N-acetylmuramoyl-pentapeptide-transferase [Actinomycetota bacterium]
MIAMLSAAAVGFTLTILLTPVAIRFFRARAIGQYIQEEVDHDHKHGVPTMGGVVMILAVLVAYLVAHVRLWSAESGWGLTWREFQIPGLLVLVGFVGMGMIGFLDDVSKVSRERNLGLRKRWKFGGQLAIASIFAWGAINYGVSTEVSFTRGLGFDLHWFYALWVLFMLVGAANAVNFTDGLDGLAAGSGGLVFGAFVVIAFWQFRHPEFYGIVGTLELAILAAALMAAAAGFLWWNTAPAKIMMGDTGSQALGGAMAALALLTNTHLLLVILGGLYVVETVSVILQILSFRVWGKRIFKMAPVHHHFELKGWPEGTIVVRFWIIAGLSVALGLGMFYGDFIMGGGVG